MKRKIFLNTFLITMLLFSIGMVTTIGVLYHYYSQQKTREFRSEAAYLSAVLEQYGQEALEKAKRPEENETAFRVSLIAPDGVVLYDSMLDVASLDNHGNREEFRQALETGVGETFRYSDTLARKTHYYAVRTEDGSVLRVSEQQFTLMGMLVQMIYPMVLELFLIIVLSAIMAARLSRSVMEPISQLDIESPMERDIYPELRPLVQRINAQNRQLHRQMTELREEHEKQDRIRREFTANVSHELKTPLTSISGYAELLGAGMVEGEDVSRFSGRIYDETQRLIVLVEDILKLSNLEDAGYAPELQSICLYEVCEETVERLRDVAAKRRVSLSLEGTREYVTGVRKLLEEMVFNLVDNAIKYNREDGEVAVSVTTEESGVRLSVKDTGIGIPQEDLPRVFERFFRVDKSHSKEVGGTGLGLSIVKHGASFHEATIEINSRLGVGTSISLIFPNNAAEK